MKKSNLFILLIVAIVAITIFNFLTIGESSADYKARLETERKDKNGFMLSSSSPLLEEDKLNFKGLNYYPIDESYKVTARIELTEKKQPIFIESTTGEQLKYIPFAKATFKLKEREHTVMLYQDWEERNANKLSLMFADETSAIETYGGGRYVDVMYRNTNSVVIDFNTAYNPYCHFNPEYSCPIPPRENMLNVAIEAGEKIYKND
ncbi:MULTISPECIES: DUF1684 domain-containing protein [Roseivirga]|jgi:hypothetical protein|uniref:DUF1684 domain-containing protein n=1 Tax=Roseivirga thermotolerans TaxID=1758176 RepID=A0ABQ3I2T0_9BACT|nr:MULTISPECIES: DUF1684 domain-containing protein [Roseivirga]MEC7754264.1 DUF1684 domain-containing protein [Bacteroidota bacterium]GHE50996.1 hypothetical protein GCM10011340_01320 [Roseivirga thermotolerans]|tara:strand:- start:1459 stop:2076 length:618 start_codon:yes stop_codon:yes gene_type:complete